MKDIHGQAIWDYYRGTRDKDLILHNSYGDPEPMPIEVFFREPEDFSELENQAISLCRGKTLDIGAAAGAHALLMQALEMDVEAIDISPLCCETMKHSGMSKVHCEDYAKHDQKYDTLLLLMNGLGIVGQLSQLPQFLNQCKQLLNTGGQLIFDSSDISYLYEDEGLKKPKQYFGEIRYQYEYDSKRSDWFDWLYIDEVTLQNEVSRTGLSFEVIHKEETDQYLGKITGF